MTNRRDNFSAATIRAIRDRAGGICSQPGCRKPTVGADQSSYDEVKIIGRACHIEAASPGGPRYSPRQTEAERSSIQNAIWLCGSCADLIDKNNGSDFPLATLLSWKKEAEKASSASLLFAGSMSRPDWIDHIHYAQYINLPRLGSMLGNGAVARWGYDAENGFRKRGMEVTQTMVWVQEALRRASIEALPLDEILPLSPEIEGQLISFNHRCYTKNGVNAGETVDEKSLSNFVEKKSPHFYLKAGEIKFVFPYNPAWITTSTAYSDFRGGNRQFAGLGLVKSLSDDLKRAIVSPLLVAFPRNEFMQAFYGAWDSNL